MAEVRKFDPGDGDGIQKLVREALGENVRPVHPSELKAHTGAEVEPVDPPPVFGDLGDGLKLDYLFYDTDG